MTTKFVTMKGKSPLALKSYYIGVPQHERTMGKKETYAFCAAKTGYTATAVRAVFMALRDYIKENANKGNTTYIDGVASVRISAKGAFASLAGPWVKGKNYLAVNAVEMDPFKGMLAGVTPVNNTDGAKPAIVSVLDETTGEYDLIAIGDPVSIAGTDLNPDDTAEDEYVALVDDKGVEVKGTITYSDLQNVKVVFEGAIEPGTYTIAVYTRSGMGGEYGVKRATRKVVVG